MTASMIDWSQLGAHGGLTIADLPLEGAVGVRMELIDGSLIVTPLGDLDHQEWASELTSRLRAATLPAGCRALAGANVVLGEQTLIIPDVAVIDPLFSALGGLGVTPAGLRLAVEITSPSTRRHDLTTKRELYRDWKVPYLIVDRSTAPASLLVEGDLPDYAAVLLG
jgi:Uma2 family endonuclease